MKIPAYSFLVMTGVVEILLFSSISSFGPKLFEEDFQLTATKAGLAMGRHFFQQLSVRQEGYFRLCLRQKYTYFF